ncbi:hypothetical protein IJG22_00895 [Candidatus Saccharibacteria bacterium]|nr:hypothetical protein [Candidatus Saccharibacteria bacterium]
MFAIKKARLLHQTIYAFAFAIAVLGLSYTYPVQAIKTITPTKNQITEVAEFDLQYKGSAGGTITKKYFIIPENKSGHGGKVNITVINRKTCKKTYATSIIVDHISGLYNQWGTDYVTVIGKGEQIGCFRIVNSKLENASGCPTPPSRHLSYQGTGQGNTATLNGYSFKVAGYKGGKIGVWDKSGKQVATVLIPTSIVKDEPENISVDGATGEVYISYTRHMDKGKKRSVWYKIDSSVFAEYTGKNKTSHPATCRNEQVTNSPNLIANNKNKPASQPQSTTNDKSKSTQNESATSTPSESTNNKNKPASQPQSTTNDKSKSTQNESATSTPSESTNDKKNSCGGVETVLFNCDGEDEKGMRHILLSIMDIMGVGIGILGVIGIMVAGIQYLAAAGDETKTIKARRRIAQIIIGIICYALLWSLAQWLLPGGFLS